jgi:hypothetical protein
MVYLCPSCGHRSGGWLVTNGTAWCPKCYRGTPTERARVREPQTPPPGATPCHSDTEALQALKDLFGFL